MKVLLMGAILAALALAGGCSDGDNPACEEACGILARLCEMDAEDVRECRSECKEEIDELSSAQVAAILDCLRGADSCMAAGYCLEVHDNGEQPGPGNGMPSGPVADTCEDLCDLLFDECDPDELPFAQWECIQGCYGDLSLMSPDDVSDLVDCLNDAEDCAEMISCLSN